MTPAGITIDLRAAQLEKQLGDISVTLSGMLQLTSFSQPSNIFLPNPLMSAGMVTDVRFLARKNAESEISVTRNFLSIYVISDGITTSPENLALAISTAVSRCLPSKWWNLALTVISPSLSEVIS